MPAPRYDQLGERRFEFIPLWGFLVFLLYTMPRVECRRCGVVTVEEVPWGDGKRTLTKAHTPFRARWGRGGCHGKRRPRPFAHPGIHHDGEEITSKIVFIFSDMWEPYLKVIREKCSEALHILDRFHINA